MRIAWFFSLLFIIIFSTAALKVKSQPELLFGEVRIVATGFSFAEGPTPAQDGSVYFTDIPNNIIHRWSEDKGLQTIAKNTGGANGLFFTPDKKLIACAGKTRQVIQVEADGSLRPISSYYNSKKYNRPNDVWVSQKGHIFFTDPSYYMNPSQLELSDEAVYVIINDKPQQLITDIVRPNGLVGTIDGKYLYVVEDADNRTWRYSIDEASNLAEKKLFVNVGDDGITIDKDGNVFIANKYDSSIDVFDQEGLLINKILIPEIPANLCFGGSNFDQLFVAAKTSLYTILTSTKGQQRE